MEQREYKDAPAFESRQILEIRWQMPQLENELGEIFRTAGRFTDDPKERTSIALRIFTALSKGKLEDLPESMWQALENTDSFNIQKGDFDVARKIAEENDRDFDFYLNRILSGEPVSAPTIILYRGIAHTIGGNTRLMTARVFGVQPKVIVARLDANEEAVDVPELDMNTFEMIAEAYHSFTSEYVDRSSFEKMLAAHMVDLKPDKIARIRTYADIYYGSDHPLTIEEFAKKVDEAKRAS